ncbi:MFS transporter [Rhodococcus sp. OK611]|uniref:MFS transporter n=1 Tax=unclassified Rhodococcus (in: high G+C Gram-positive bacteria) TaxID=192944 RepID=UPI000BD4C3FC|nr:MULTISPECIES: MFS transporter [unclassified Rhodococcus (in: high G+C Gram-positive bacteria)]PTR43658.1 MFS transporter [Rhodococcus sp. OK611]SNX90476.1 Major Facilitator Superfamily protein [Rhodococcus sp. OK270]
MNMPLTAPKHSRASSPKHSRASSTSVHPGLLVVALAFTVLIYSMMQTLLVPALPVLGETFGASVPATGWILTAYLMAGAVLAPVIGSLGDRYGDKRVLLAVLVVFAAATFGAALASTIEMLVVMRMVQGVSTAAFPLALAVLRRNLSGPAMAAGIGWVAGMLGLGAGAALVLGGLILEYLSWQWLFVGTGILILVALAMVARWVPQVESAEVASRTDWVGTVLLSSSLVALLLATTQGGTWGWTAPATLGLFAVALLAAVALVVAELRQPNPLVDVRSLVDAPMALTSLVTLVLGFIPYVFYLCIPRILQAPHATGYGSGFTVVQTGLALLPSAVMVFLGGRIASSITARFGLRTPAVAAMVLMGLGAAGMAVWPTQIWSLVVFFSLIGLGNGLGYAICAQLLAVLVPPTEMAAASGLNSVIRTIGSAISAPVTTAVLVAGGQDRSAYVGAFVVAVVLSLLGAGTAAGLRTAR